ncbi:MAG: hypothetical protein KR126chlam1_01369 [Chlamydiae bacterium]|nr:hypothetical protein [Chlamydiota bacterium]
MVIVAIFAYLLVGIIAGIGAGLLGMSGGVLAVPALVLIFTLLGFPQPHLMHMAIGTSLASMILTTLSATVAHHRRGGVMWDIIWSMMPGVILGCLLGAFIAHFLSSVILEIIFGFFICFLGAYVLFHKKKKEEVKRPDRTLYTWIGLGIGSLSSLLGIGGGTFMVPLFIAYQYPSKKAVGTSAGMSLFITTFAALAYLYLGLGEIKIPYTIGFIYLPAFALIGITTIFAAPIGVKLAHRMRGRVLRRIFAVTLIVIGVLMIFR